MAKSLRLEATDPFTNLENLRLDQSYAETLGVKKLLRTVPVRKPGQQDFVRTHPEHRLTPAALIELKDDREIYFVAPSMVSELAGEFFVATLYLTINRQNIMTLWPVRLPGPDGKHLEWHRSAAEAAEVIRLTMSARVPGSSSRSKVAPRTFLAARTAARGPKRRSRLRPVVPRARTPVSKASSGVTHSAEITSASFRLFETKLPQIIRTPLPAVSPMEGLLGGTLAARALCGAKQARKTTFA